MASSGNFCTLNPLAQPNSGTYSEGNLLFTHTTADWRTSSGTLAVSSGKWYWEAYQYESLSGNGFPVGIYDISGGKLVSNQASAYPGRTTSTYGLGYAVYSNSGTYASKYTNQTETNTSLSIGVSGDVWQCALDLDNNKLWFGKNNSWDNSANPALGTNQSYAIDSGKEYVPVTCSYNDSGSENFPQNFGQDSTFSGRISAGGNADGNGFGDFKYAPPSGFLALCSANLPISADIDPAQTSDDYVGGKQFNCVTYTGNASTNAITGLGFKPDLVWVKVRNNASASYMADSSRGTNKTLSSTLNEEERTEANLTSFDTDGFTLSSHSSYINNWNQNTWTYVGWGWKANGGTTASNTSGDINSTTQANTKSGFSIVTYTGNGSSAQSIGHGLSSGAPELIFVKNRSQGDDWAVYHVGAGNAAHLILNSYAAQVTSSAYWGSFTPTTTLFKVGSDHKLNASSENYVAYLWHGVEGSSRFSTYTGNGNADGPFVYTGFRPRMVFLKSISGGAEWTVFDTARETYNQMEDILQWDLANAETQLANDKIDFLSNGFKLRGAGGGRTNQSGHTYVYGAWGDVPFKYNNTF